MNLSAMLDDPCLVGLDSPSPRVGLWLTVCSTRAGGNTRAWPNGESGICASLVLSLEDALRKPGHAQSERLRHHLSGTISATRHIHAPAGQPLSAAQQYTGTTHAVSHWVFVFKVCVCGGPKARV